MAQSGLNIATQAGEGGAPILHWEMFNATVNNIYQRDLLNQKNILNEYTKLNIGLNDASKGIRPADMPLFKQNYDKFKQASLMMQSPKIRNNPQELAFWKHQQDDSYLSNMSLANQSEQAQTFKADTWKGIAANPEKYYDHDHLMKINEMYDSLPVSELNKMGMNTAVPWMHPSDAYPQEQFDKHVLGDPKIVPGKAEDVMDSQGRKMGWFNTTQEMYAKKPSQIAADVGIGMQQVWSVAKQWQQKYNNDMQQPEVVKETIDKAQQVIDADPTNSGYKLDRGYVGYAAANYILRAQPTTTGSRSFQEDPEYKTYTDALKKKEDERFQMGKLSVEHGYRLGEIQFRKTLSDMGIKFSGAEMYGAATDPNHLYVPADGKKGDKPIYGFQLLDKRMAEIMSKAPKNLDYGIITRFNIVNAAERRRLIDKIFGAPTSTTSVGADATEKKINQLKKELYQGGSGNEDAVKRFIELARMTGMDINEQDVNNSAIPIIIDKLKGSTSAVPINPATHSYDQFVQQISQILNANKPKGSILDDEDFNTGTLDSLHNYVNPNR